MYIVQHPKHLNSQNFLNREMELLLTKHNYLFLGFSVKSAYIQKRPTRELKMRKVRKNTGFDESEESCRTIFSCPSCGRKYALRRSLLRHIRFECGGQRKYQCNLCPASYTQNGSLRRHLASNHNISFPAKKKFIIPQI